MTDSAVRRELLDSDPPTPIDLDAILDAEIVGELVVIPPFAESETLDAEIVPMRYISPLEPDYLGGPYPTRLRGGFVDDPAEVAAIGECIAFGKRSWLYRLTHRAPAGW